MKEEKRAIAILNQETFENLLFEIRGQKVMLDFDLANIYGYETRSLNQQVKRNIEKFPDDFMFQITKVELDSIMMSQNVISRKDNYFVGQEGGTRKLPYAFTEQGIYMLMTVLKGELATEQSRTLIRLFKNMKDYIQESQNLLVNTNQYIESRFASYDDRFRVVENKLDVIMDSFTDPSKLKHFLILNGQRVEADIAYQKYFQSQMNL